MKLILLDLWYSGKQEDMYIFKIGPSKKVLEIPYPRNSAWLPRGLLVKCISSKIIVVLWTKAVVYIWKIDVTNNEDRANGLLIVQSKAFLVSCLVLG